MATTRRGFIRVLGGGVVAAAAIGGGLTQCDRMPASAVAPWAGPGGETEPRRRALAWALLAPNPHNIQPWQVDLRQPDVIDLYVDAARLLPHTDPFARQIVIGHGTFLETLALAAARDGFRADIALFPAGPLDEARIDARPLARIRLVPAPPDAAAAALAAQIPLRRSTKTPYRAEPLSDVHAGALAAFMAGSGTRLTLVREASAVATLRDLTIKAMLREIETPRTLKESVDLTRIGAKAIARNPDGIDLHGPLFWWLKTLGQFTPEQAMTPGTPAYQGAIDYALGYGTATHSFGWLATAGNDRAAQVAAGRAYQRLALQATALGVAMHPVSQLLQEYPEMAALQQDFLAQAAPRPGESVQMLFRLGYAAAEPPSPRRPLSALLMT